MTTTFQSHRRTAAVLLAAGIALAGCAGFATSPSPAVQQQIETARSRADHEALAKHYSGEAAAARAKVAEHRQMAAGYQGMIGGGRGGGGMAAHCNAIASSFEGIAAQLDAMAAGHRQMAEQANL